MSAETYAKIEERLKPKRPEVEEDEEVPELPPIIRDDSEEQKGDGLKVEEISDSELMKLQLTDEEKK